MAKDISEIRQEIYNFDKDYETYKNNSFLVACFKLTCAAENCFLDIMRSLINPLYIENAQALQDNIRGAYREALKHAYKFCTEHKDEEKMQMESSELDKTIDELTSYIDFNQARNMFEQYDLGRYKIIVNSDNEITFERNKAKRSIDAELYARWVDKQKPELEERQLKEGAETQIFRNMADPHNCRFWDFNNKSFSNVKHLKDIYKLALKKVNCDTEELGNYDFGTFTTEEFQKVYSVLISISVTNINYHFFKRMGGGFEMDKNTPIVVFKLNELIDLIKELSGLKEETITAIINKLNYDPEFHKDKITIFQPLFVAQEEVFFSPSLIYFGMAYGKLLYVIKSDSKYKQLISEIARDREQIMTDDLCDFIENNSELLYTTNYIVKEGATALAEFDLILYDEHSRRMLICELKWFFAGDGEYDAAKVEKRIQDAIGKRLKREEIAKAHLNEIKNEMGLEKDEDFVIQSCIISKNYAGSDFLEDDLPVFDVFWFKQLLADLKFDFAQLFKLIEKKSYLPAMEESGYQFVSRNAEYAGYKINMESVAYKNLF